MTHPASEVAPPSWPKIRLGGKKFELQYNFASQVVVGERHGSLSNFSRDFALAGGGAYSMEKIEVTILLAGLRHDKRITEDVLFDLIGRDYDAVREHAVTGMRAMAREWNWGWVPQDDDEDDSSGEAPAGESPA